MDELRRLWLEFNLTALEAGIHARLPWDTGDSRLLLWLSVAVFVIAALTTAQLFGAMCGWIATRLVSPRQGG